MGVIDPICESKCLFVDFSFINHDLIDLAQQVCDFLLTLSFRVIFAVERCAVISLQRSVLVEKQLTEALDVRLILFEIVVDVEDFDVKEAIALPLVDDKVSQDFTSFEVLVIIKQSIDSWHHLLESNQAASGDGAIGFTLSLLMRRDAVAKIFALPHYRLELFLLSGYTIPQFWLD